MRSGLTAGAIPNQLLEKKSRVVYQQPGERNYHTSFYQLLCGADRLQLHQPEYFRYVSQSGWFTVDDVDDGKDFAEVAGGHGHGHHGDLQGGAGHHL